LGGSIARPMIFADSTMAVRVSGCHHQWAAQGRWAASMAEIV
jgi:hypothetical protein